MSREFWDPPVGVTIPDHIRALAEAVLTSDQLPPPNLDSSGPLSDWVAENIPMLAPFIQPVPPAAKRFRSVRVGGAVLTRHEAWLAARLVVLEILARNSYDPDGPPPGRTSGTKHAVQDRHNASIRNISWWTITSGGPAPVLRPEDATHMGVRYVSYASDGLPPPAAGETITILWQQGDDDYRNKVFRTASGVLRSVAWKYVGEIGLELEVEVAIDGIAAVVKSE